MTTMQFKSSAIILIDFINDIVSEGGKLSGKGYLQYIEKHRVGDNVDELVRKGRSAGTPVIHVRVGFSKNYLEHPAGSPLFGGAKKFGALSLGDWGTEFADFAVPADGELVVTKHRVSAFYGTDLDVMLRALKIQTVVLAGCATDLAVQSAARDAHDRDFGVVVVDDACGAANDADHENSLAMLSKIATVALVERLEFN